MDTDTACRQCRCDNGTAAACQNVESARCPTRNQERACTRANGDTIANGERVMVNDYYMNIPLLQHMSNTHILYVCLYHILYIAQIVLCYIC